MLVDVLIWAIFGSFLLLGPPLWIWIGDRWKKIDKDAEERVRLLKIYEEYPEWEPGYILRTIEEAVAEEERARHPGGCPFDGCTRVSPHKHNASGEFSHYTDLPYQGRVEHDSFGWPLKPTEIKTAEKIWYLSKERKIPGLEMGEGDQ